MQWEGLQAALPVRVEAELLGVFFSGCGQPEVAGTEGRVFTARIERHDVVMSTQQSEEKPQEMAQENGSRSIMSLFTIRLQKREITMTERDVMDEAHSVIAGE